jgi:serine/threonine-protein phosphatase 6 regulatory subunit 3
MSFWRSIGFHTVSAIDNILDKEHFTLEELLDEEELLQECKSQNKKLLDYLVEPATLAKLFEYITKEAPDDADPKRKFKYPFVASEVLSSDIWTVVEAIYSDEALISLPYSFLDTDNVSPVVVASLTKVASVLFSRKVTETMKVLRKKEDALGKFVKHIGATSVMELLLKIVTTADNADGAQIFPWLSESKLVEKLVAQFDPKNSAEVHENVGTTLVEIICMPSATANSSYQYPHNPLMQQLTDEKTLATLFSYVLTDGSKSALMHGLTVVIELLRRCVAPPSDVTVGQESLPPILRLVLDHLPKFSTLLASSTGEQVPMTFGTLSPPLGFHRLKVLEFFAALFKTSYRAVEQAIMTANVLPACLDLFFAYPWNNFLHSVVEQIVIHILEGQNQELKLYLLQNCKLVQRIIEGDKRNQAEVNRERGLRLGFMGFITSMSLAIESAAAPDSILQSVLDENEDWKTYVNGSLLEIRSFETKPLGGHRPLSFGPESDDDDSDDGDYDPNHQDLSFNPNALNEDFEEDGGYIDSNEVVFEGEVDNRDSFPDMRSGDPESSENPWNEWELKTADDAEAHRHRLDDDDSDDDEDSDGDGEGRSDDAINHHDATTSSDPQATHDSPTKVSPEPGTASEPQTVQ